jgi:hypothetical protein
MMRRGDLRLDANQAVEVNPVRRRLTIPAPNSPRPSGREPDAGHPLKQVNAVRRESDLHNLFHSPHLQQQRAAELRQRSVGAADVLGGGINPQINVFVKRGLA